MSGLNMMLKSMGLNPDEITKAATEFGATVARIERRIVRSEKMLEIILAKGGLEIPPRVE